MRLAGYRLESRQNSITTGKLPAQVRFSYFLKEFALNGKDSAYVRLGRTQRKNRCAGCVGGAGRHHLPADGAKAIAYVLLPGVFIYKN